MLDLGRTLLYVTEREPSAIAVIDGETTLTYGAWLDRTLGAVAGLDALGLRRGDHLVTILQNTLDAATLHWACQLAGVVITPVNWRAKPDEAEYVLADAGARAVCFEPVSAAAVANAPHAGTVPRIAAGGACGGTLAFQELWDLAPADALARAKPDDISVMLYTSGTTGRPKGVPRTHAAERSGALAHVAQNRYGYGERTLGVMPLYHTMGVRSLLAMALISGTWVCQPRFETSGALDLIERHRVTNLYLVPTLYHDLLADPGFEVADVSSVRKLGFAGRADDRRPAAAARRRVSPGAVRQPLRLVGDLHLHGLPRRPRQAGLGGARPASTSASGWCESGARVRATPRHRTRKARSSRRSIPTRRFAGYWRRPDADAKALRAGWYFTGDIGYFDRDGDLFVTGRVDDMMISGGENVMPVEIESVLSLHPGVAEVAVAGLPDERLGQRITAFVTRRAEAGPDVDANALDAFCKASELADYKRPRAYVFVRSIPKSPVGKILRRLLIAGEYEAE